MLALSIRQPFAELILRGIKTVEYRSRATRIVGRRFWIYASKGGDGAANRRKDAVAGWSYDLSTTADPPRWMVELAEQVRMIPPGTVLPRGVIVGSAVIAKCEPTVGSGQWAGAANDEVGIMNDESGRANADCGMMKAGTGGASVHHSSFIIPHFSYAWHLADVRRLARPRRPAGRPQPVWFRAF